MSKPRKNPRPSPSHHRRLPEWEAFDHIELKQEPRYKQSGLSGDEWRTSVRVRLWFKGAMLHEFSFGSMDATLALLPAKLMALTSPITEEHVNLDRSRCSQPGCSQAPVTGQLRIKRLTTAEGDYLDPSEYPQPDVPARQFCAAHRRRGNASREDNDDNYELLDTPKAKA